jgi:hypothetical protein
VAGPRLEQEDNASVVWSGIQVALNNVARSITGTRRRDHVHIEDLLAQAGLESSNRMVVKAIAAETWGCFHSDDGREGSRNHVGRIIFSDKKNATSKTTRSAKTGLVEVPLRGGNTFVTHAAHVLNRFGHATPGDHEGEGQKGYIRLGGSIAAVVLQRRRLHGRLPPAGGYPD